MKTIPVDLVRHLFTYRSGQLIWQNCSKTPRNGKPAGYINHHISKHDRLQVLIPGYGHYKVARVIWAIVKGSDPYPNEIDHIDQNPLNNNIENLRLACRAENTRNRKNAFPSNIAGIKGVGARTNGTFSARITRNYKTIHLGYFSTKEEAAAAYRAAASKLHEEFASY